MSDDAISALAMLDQAIFETEEYLGQVKALADGSGVARRSHRALNILHRLSAAARIASARLSETEFILREARIACPLCRGKGYWSTDVYKNRPCHCKAGELFKSLTSAHVRVGVAMILRRGDSVLMGLRKGSHGAGTWSFPGGHLEVGETVTTCAARELLEETGIECGSEMRKLTYTNDIFSSEDKHYVTLYVEAEWQAGMPEPQVMEPEKCAEWRFFSEPPSPLFLPIENLLKDNFKIWKNDWKAYEALFKWRDDTTDYYGEDLVSLLSGLGGFPSDHRLPSSLVEAWEAFGKLDAGVRWAHAEAFVRATEPPGLKSYGSEDSDP